MEKQDKKFIFLGFLLVVLLILGLLLNNKRKEILIEKEIAQIYEGMTKSELLEIWGEPNIIASRKDFSYIPHNVEKYYYNREIDLYPLIKNDFVVQIIISIDKKSNRVSEIVIRDD